MIRYHAYNSWVFLRALSLVYLVAFLSLALQVKGLWSSEGILPIADFVKPYIEGYGLQSATVLPSLFLLDASDTILVAAAWVGVLASFLALIGLFQGWMLFACFVLYLSFTTAGQDFMSFQWDSLLVEVGFLALFAAPWRQAWTPVLAYEPPKYLRWAMYTVLFKLMFLSGVVKLTSGDESWRDFTALTYHYFTQPIPNPVAFVMNALPLWFHAACTAITLAVELVLPFCIWFPRTRVIAGAGFLGLSFMILTSGNYAFFNWLTIALCIWTFPLDWLFERKLHFIRKKVLEDDTPLDLVLRLLFVPLMTVSLYWCVRWSLPAVVDAQLFEYARWPAIWRINTPYGLFANMTKARPEIVIEGTTDGLEWRPYEFRYKPGDPSRMPPIVAPHQPRLDWQMWFAALGRYEQAPWLEKLMKRLLEGSAPVVGLFDKDPFDGMKPVKVRAVLYMYQFSTPAELSSTGHWWHRTLRGNFSPEIKAAN